MINEHQHWSSVVTAGKHAFRNEECLEKHPILACLLCTKTYSLFLGQYVSSVHAHAHVYMDSDTFLSSLHGSEVIWQKNQVWLADSLLLTGKSSVCIPGLVCCWANNINVIITTHTVDNRATATASSVPIYKPLLPIFHDIWKQHCSSFSKYVLWNVILWFMWFFLDQPIPE